jgi:hypothetical protein
MQLNFDATQIPPDTGAPGGLPPGRYPVVISETEAKPVKSGDGGMLQITFKVTQGPHVGQTQRVYINLWHNNPQTAEIAAKQFSAICHVTGQFRVQATEQLMNIPLQIEVGPQRDNPVYSEVKGYFDANGNPPGKAGQGQQTNQPAAAAAATNTASNTGTTGWQQPGQTTNQPANNAGGTQPAAWGQPAGQNGGTQPADTGAAGTGWAQPVPANTGTGSWQQPGAVANASNGNNTSNNNAGGNPGGWQPPAGNSGGWQQPGQR